MRSQLHHLLAGLPGRLLEAYRLVHKHRLLPLSWTDENQFLFEAIDPGPADPEGHEAAGLVSFLLQRRDPSLMVATHCVAELLGEGVKAFRLPAAACESLEHTELNVAVEDYAQPFPTFAVDLPEDYARAREVTGGWEDRYHPLAVIVSEVLEHRAVFLTALTSDASSLTRAIRLRPGHTVEEDVVETEGTRMWDAGGVEVPSSDAERALMSRLTRLALNVALMADSYGVRRAETPEEGQRRAKLTAKLKTSPKPQAVRDELSRLPLYYGFDQEVVLTVRRGSAERPEHDGTGRTLSVHWRRGHWRSQACGPGYSQHKRVRVPAVLVNARLLAEGTAGNVTYRPT